MIRFLPAAVLALLAAGPATAQDMPLSQILIDGEGWKKVDAPKRDGANQYLATPSPDRGTIFYVVRGAKFLWAAPADAKGFVVNMGAPYAPLRTRRGEKTIEVTGLTTDGDGRIYALTEIGVQVFDPTGRLCGVMTPAAPGKPDEMAFEGDKLTLWIGNEKYARKLRTEGMK